VLVWLVVDVLVFLYCILVVLCFCSCLSHIFIELLCLRSSHIWILQFIGVRNISLVSRREILEIE